jgi:CBS domain-containing protein
MAMEIPIAKSMQAGAAENRGPSMAIGTLCNRTVVFARPDATIAEAAMLMRREHVGDIVVVDASSGRRPVGIVTDRDIVVEVVSAGLDPHHVTLADLALRPPVTAGEEDSCAETIARMTAKGVRRIPIVDRDGLLVGIVTFDDLLQSLAVQIGELAKIPAWERALEARVRK